MYLLTGEETTRIQFREILPSDLDLWLPFFKDPSSFIHWQSILETPKVECEKWFANQYKRFEENRGGMNALIEKQSGKLIGYCGLLVQHVDGLTELEIAYSLLPQFRGMGFATEAAGKCRDFAFENTNKDSLISIISLTNTESANVARKIGMKIEKQTVYKGNDVNIHRISKVISEVNR
jgi:RimJ/RimL family protein N-acetyltransferase